MTSNAERQAAARVSSLTRRLATAFPHHLFAHSWAVRLGSPAGDAGMARPLTAAEFASDAVIEEDREFFSLLGRLADAGLDFCDARESALYAAVTVEMRQGELVAAPADDDDGWVDF